MTDLITRDAAIDRLTELSCDDNAHWGAIIDALRAIPAIDPAAIRDAALREAEKIAEYHAGRNCTASDVLRDIRRAMIGEKK